MSMTKGKNWLKARLTTVSILVNHLRSFLSEDKSESESFNALTHNDYGWNAIEAVRCRWDLAYSGCVPFPFPSLYLYTYCSALLLPISSVVALSVLCWQLP
jgi:hypothetical protein